MTNTRGRSGGQLFPKGYKGGRQLVSQLKEDGYTAFLNDQKMNDGIETTFFKQPAMSAPALAQLALKHKLPILPIFCHRTEGGRFVVDIKAPLAPEAKGKTTQDKIAALTQCFNDVIEEEVCNHPEQWLWMHKRFKV